MRQDGTVQHNLEPVEALRHRPPSLSSQRTSWSGPDTHRPYPRISITESDEHREANLLVRHRTAPLCQGAAVLAVDFCLVEEVVVEAGTGVEDLDADEAAVFPVERDEPLGAGRRGGLDGGAAG